MLLNAGFLWAGSAVLAGWIVGRSRFLAGVGAGFVVLICAVASYYGYGLTLGDRAEGGLAALSGVIRLWLIASVLAGPLLGATGVLTHRTDFLGLLARLTVPAGALVEMLFIRRLGPESFRVDPTLAWTQMLVVVLACLGAVWVAIKLSGSRSGSTVV